METSGISDAFRYIDNDAESSKPYLAFYPMPDLAFTQGEEFKKIRVKSELLPGSQMCFDLADFDARIYGLTAKVGSRDGVASTLFVTAIEPGTGSSDAEVEKWFEGDVSTVDWESRIGSMLMQDSFKTPCPRSQVSKERRVTSFCTLGQTRNREHWEIFPRQMRRRQSRHLGPQFMSLIAKLMRLRLRP